MIPLVWIEPLLKKEAEMGNIFNPDFQDFIRAINRHHVEYVLVGGYSVIAHGYARTTGDMDIWVNRTAENYKKLCAAFEEFKLPVFEMTQSNFLDHPDWDVFRFGRPPVAIDIMTKVKGMEFTPVYLSSEIKHLDGLDIRVICYPDLIKAKAASGRNKDLDDINSLENK
jgi:predicted nucleotidyltransferase